MVGCGNSKLSEEMAVDGYPMVTNVDISTSVVNKMSEHYSSKFPL
jgi:2-polyprenyl-3-methyl-5-hydroxy-6-metoxy-1,4-benzoquinol methylase